MRFTVVISWLILAALPVVVQAAGGQPVYQSEEQKLLLRASGEGIDAQMAQLNNNPGAAKRHFAQSIKYFDQALALNPENMRTLVNRGLTKNMMQKGSGNADLKEAITLGGKLIASKDNTADYYYLRSVAYRNLKQNERAKEDLIAAINLNPGRTSWQNDLKALENPSIVLHQ
jgi:tetratricopeptide (TPR) repeat protein